MTKSIAFSAVLVVGLLACIGTSTRAQQPRYVSQVYVSPQLRQQGRQIQQQYRTARQDTIRQLETRRQNTPRNVYVQRRWRDIPFNWAVGAATGGYKGALQEMIPDLFKAYRRQRQRR
jgi:hypothetical protein